MEMGDLQLSMNAPWRTWTFGHETHAIPVPSTQKTLRVRRGDHKRWFRTRSGVDPLDCKDRHEGPAHNRRSLER
ncbi:hypothetical protein CY34DRAFT_360836 [Suillus luteus UH-Slu-Lm8-n1]|uniref:Uncharacterized protein n=1 Tax=Suillus luteus UH-Slu-Lm8-n1 TaxID=930992 RepID=A0A0C9ZN69_9AGAM|nr:hypothetical protein CY34DRAFT_360836 [Suillus luteus UH-Slu-Lm8-n1]